MTETTTLPPPKINIDDSIRGWANVLCLWRFCRHKRCTAALACRGNDVRRCFHAHYILLPDSVQLWFDALKEAQEDGLSWAQAIGRSAPLEFSHRPEPRLRSFQ